MFEGLLKSKFYTKSKSNIKLIRARIDMILKKRSSVLNQMRRDIADLLQSGLAINAYGRPSSFFTPQLQIMYHLLEDFFMLRQVDGLLAELNRQNCYEYIEKSSLQVLNHLGVMNKQRECPEDCKEAVSSLMFAAARFADLPELRDLRALFLEKYGDSMNSYANKEFVQKLKSGGSPSKDMKLQLLQDIAAEYSLQWKDLRNKLRNEPAAEKSLGTKTIDDKCSIPVENTSDSVGKTVPGGAKNEYKKNLREIDIPKKRNDLSKNGHEEVKKIKDIVSLKREDVASPTDRYVPRMPKMPDERPPVKDILVDTEARSEKAAEKGVVLRADNHENKPQKLKVEDCENVDHIKHEVSNSHLSEYKYSTTDKRTDNARPGLIRKVKPVPKSVRTREVKPSVPMHENAGNSGKRDHSKERKENVGEGRRILKFLDEGCNNQDDEKKMDELLLHYSNKKGPQDTRKSSSNLSLEDASKNSRDGPDRTTSLPCETLHPAETSKVHTRASSFEPQILKEKGHAHVHPKLPEYDDFVARLASLRGRQ